MDAKSVSSHPLLNLLLSHAGLRALKSSTRSFGNLLISGKEWRSACTIGDPGCKFTTNHDAVWEIELLYYPAADWC